MIPRAINHVAHSQPRPSFVDCDHRATDGKLRQLESLIYDNHNVAVFQFGTFAHSEMRSSRANSARRFGIWPQGQLTACFVAFAWGRLSCVQYRESSAREPLKPSDKRVGRPTTLSVMRFHTSASSFFGRKIRRHISLRPLRNSAARSVRHERQSDISAVTAIGRATRRPRSSPKFLNVRECATSA